jgi:hypothetical protein
MEKVSCLEGETKMQHAPNPSLRPKGVTPREWRRKQNTKFVRVIRARKRAGVRVFTLPLNADAVVAWLIANGRLPPGESGKGAIEAALATFITEQVT